MSSGGRFAGCLFEGSQATGKHRAFQRYTVRKKQGGSQASKDGQSGTKQPHSIGSSLRRQEAVRYTEQLQETLNAWAQDLEKCSLIFLFAPSSNLGLFFYEGTSHAFKPRKNP